MKCAVCIIIKQENDYIREFVTYHLSIGYDTIFIYDNNEPLEEQACDVLADYIASNQVVIISAPESHRYAQRRAYTDCYNNYAHDYDWISFIDADEFITLKKHRSIKEYLSEPCFESFNVIQLNWMCYGDSGLIKRTCTSEVLERFHSPIMPLSYSENKVIKSTLRGRQTGVSFESAHFPSPSAGRVCDSLGCQRAAGLNESDEIQFEVAYIRHYMTKTLEEYIVNKLRRKGVVNSTEAISKRRLTLKYFWMRNEKTAEKVAYAKQIMGTREYYTYKYYELDKSFNKFVKRNKRKFIHPLLVKFGIINR